MARRPSPKQLACFYHALARGLESGWPIIAALEAGSAHLAPAADWSRRLQAGEAWDSILRTAPSWFPWTDRYLLSAGAESGRLAEAALGLAERWEGRAQWQAMVAGSLVYPLALAHLAAILLPLGAAVETDSSGSLSLAVAPYLAAVATILGPLWISLIGIRVLVRARPGWAARLGSLLPGVGAALRLRSWSDFAQVLGDLQRAGAPLASSLRVAGLSAGSRSLEVAAGELEAEVQAGLPMGPCMRRSDAFPPAFATRVLVAESTGQVEETLRQLARENRQAALEAMRRAAFWYPKLVFLVVAMLVAWGVLQHFRNYLAQIPLQ